MSDVEEFKPIPIRHDEGALGTARFQLRLLGDLQLLTCVRFLRPHLIGMRGDVLDVGCGEMPFRSMIEPEARYVGLDFPGAASFGMRNHPDIVSFDGSTIPFPDNSFDHVLCTEVLEHAEHPAALVAEMHRVLRPGGNLIATVPFSARVHHAPYDFQRFTSYGLEKLFARFTQVTVTERGDDFAVIANKLIVVCARLLRPTRFPLLLLAAPFALLALALAHLSLIFGWGGRADPLGYGVRAQKAMAS